MSQANPDSFGSRMLRLLVAGLAALVLLGVLLVLLMASDLLLSVIDKLERISPQALLVYLGLLLATGLLVTAIFWRWLTKKPKRSPPATKLSREELQQRIEERSSAGVDTITAQAELDELDARNAKASLTLAVWGEISTGKSTLINALIPGAQSATSAVGGTTDRVVRHTTTLADAVALEILDLPGSAQVDNHVLAGKARDEALRADVILYICDGDLNRHQVESLESLHELRKPVIVVVNKFDRYDAQQGAEILTQVRQRAQSLDALTVVGISSGGEEEVVIESQDGTQSTVARPRNPDLSNLMQALAKNLTGREQQLAADREAAFVTLAARKLESSEQRYREAAAQGLIKKYSRRAVIAALATITPGSDLIIQGALAAKFMSDLAALYERPIKSLDIDKFVSAAGGRLRNLTSITLAIAGNALKAFPGVGTVAGGLTHAVAYGMIFESLGTAAAKALAEDKWEPESVADQFEQELTSRMESSAGAFARLALRQMKQSK